MSRCAIHNDAYDSVHICAACRRDPANAEWVAHVDAEAAAAAAEIVADRWEPDEMDRKIARALVLGKLSYRAAAKEACCTLARVVAFVDSIMVSQERMRRVWPERKPTSACTHAWQPRSDLGRGCYSCSACGLEGRKKRTSGTVTPNVRHPGHRRPEQTVAFKPLGSGPASDEDGPFLAPMYSTRSVAHRHMEEYLDVQAEVDRRAALFTRR